MRKSKKVLIAVLALLLIACGVAAAMVVANIAERNKQEAARKEASEKAPIVEAFHDQGYTYMTPEEPKQNEEVTLRLRTERYNVTQAQIQYTTDEGVTWKTVDMELEKKDDTGYFDIFKGSFTAEGDLIRYRFVLGNKERTNAVYYDTVSVGVIANGTEACWQIVPGHTVPQWAKGALFYSLVPDRFYNGNTMNDKRVSGDNATVSWSHDYKMLDDKYGGDLAGIEAKLDYISSFHVDAIYINPITKAYHSIGYGPLRFDEIEQSLGNKEDLESLAASIHENGMYLLGDVVLTFTDNESYYSDKSNRWPTVGAVESKESQWSDFFKVASWPGNFLSTTWSGPAIDLNSESAKKTIYEGSDSYMLQYANLFDGYRFDCGGYLWGTSETDDIGAGEMIKRIRESVKTVNDEFLLISEYDNANMNKGGWDAQWNLTLNGKLQDYARGNINETLMVQAMHDCEMTYPRNVALCMSNMIGNHDISRVVQDKDYLFNAAVLIQMTYLGSPTIYYGDEVATMNAAQFGTGVGGSGSFTAFDWDETNWNYRRMNFYKAIGELRQEYSCVKTGVVNLLKTDIENHVIVFGRWDENGAAVTVTSQNDEVITVDVPMKNCDVKNGTVVTDYLTGKQYVVKDGVITVEVIPGGSVFVTGKQASSYRQGYEIHSVGKASDSTIETETDISFSLNGKGKLGEKADELQFAASNAYNAFSVYGCLRGDGNNTMMIRQSMEKDSVYYAAVKDGDKILIQARTAAGEKGKVLAEIEYTKDTYIKLERTAENHFKGYKTQVKDGVLGEWTEIKDSSVQIGMTSGVYYGFAALKGKTRVNNLTFEAVEERMLFDEFEGPICTSLFSDTNDKAISLKDGKLVIINAEDSVSRQLTNTMDAEWTFKTLFSSSMEKSGYAGVVSYQDENHYVIAGRTKKDSKDVLFIGKFENGSFVIYDYVEDVSSEEDVIVQLQRIGTYYSAIYSYDEEKTWNNIGRMYTNFSDEKAGIIVSGIGEAAFDWVSFGDSIHDGVSVNTPYSPGTINTSYGRKSECQYEYLTGEWSLVQEGWGQTSKEGFAQAAAVNQTFGGLIAEATLKITEGDGWAALAFGKAAPDSGKDDGFALRYYKNGTLELTRNGEVLSTVEVEKKEAMRIVVDAADGRIIVYAGQEPKPVIAEYDTGYEEGYISLCTYEAKAEFFNIYHGATDASWNTIKGESVGAGTGIIANCTSSSASSIVHTVETLQGYGFTDFVCTARIGLIQVFPDMDASAGLLFCANEGYSEAVDGVYVYVDGKSRLVLSVKGEEKAAYQLPENTKIALIMVVKQKGAYRVFLHGENEPVLQYEEDYNRGGVFSLYAINSFGNFTNIAIESLQPEQDYATSDIASKWKGLNNKTYRETFDSSKAMDNFLKYGTESEYKVENGMLTCYESNGWHSGVAVMEDTYSDFTMSFKLRMETATDGWCGIATRKTRANLDHNSAGLWVLISPKGAISFHSSVKDGIIQSETQTISNFTVGEWYDCKIVASGNVTTIYVNGEKVGQCISDQYKEGFVSFQAGMSQFSIDNLVITSER